MLVELYVNFILYKELTVLLSIYFWIVFLQTVIYYLSLATEISFLKSIDLILFELVLPYSLSKGCCS